MGNIGSHVDITSGAREHQANRQQIAAELSVNTFSVMAAERMSAIRF